MTQTVETQEVSQGKPEAAESVEAAPEPAAADQSPQAQASPVTEADALPSPADGAGQEAQAVEVRPAHLPEEAEQTVAAGGGQVDILLNATMPVTASLGNVTVQVRQILQLGPGSVIKLERKVGEPIDLYLRGIRFATGQLVVVGDHMGVRIREILPSGVAEGAAGSS
jgi:flagellar motor switch protein FliN/FliY